MKLDSRKVNNLSKNVSIRNFVKRYINDYWFDAITRDAMAASSATFG